MIKKRKIGIFIISSSKLMTNILRETITEEAYFSFEGVSFDLNSSINIMKKKSVNVLVIDLVNENNEAIEAIIKKVSEEFPIPIIFISSQEFKGVEVQKEIPFEVVIKPSDIESNKSFLKELQVKIKIISTEKVDKSAAVDFNSTSLSKTDKIIAIGASTGGVEALSQILCQLPEKIPGIVIVQHMPPKFSKLFADRLNTYSKIMIKEACDGDEIKQGLALVAPGDKHLKVVRSGDKYLVKSYNGDRVSGHCPSVDVLFESVAQAAGSNAIGVILTGMGMDGAKGLLSMRKKGAITIGQDKSSCVVYGMPMEAFNLGAVGKQVTLNGIAKELILLTNA